MPSEEQITGLQQYAIGPKIGALRLKKRLSLAELGRRSGLSAGLLSKVERGLVFPRLATLLEIAVVLDVGLEHFFVKSMKDPTIAVVRKKDRLRLSDPLGKGLPTFFLESLISPVTNRMIEAYYARFESSGKPTLIQSHPGDAFIYVLSGELIVNMRGADIRLGKSDSIYF